MNRLPRLDVRSRRTSIATSTAAMNPVPLGHCRQIIEATIRIYRGLELRERIVDQSRTGILTGPYDAGLSAA